MSAYSYEIKVHMRTFLFVLLGLLAMNVLATESIQTPAFELKLSGAWVRERSSAPEQYSYYSKELNTGITASFILQNAKSSDTERIANKLKEFRLAGEDKAASEFNLKMTIAEPIVLPFSKGHQVAYYGHDSQNRQFRYLGLVLPNKTISIYAESKSKSQQELETIFNQLIKRLKF